MFAEKEYRKLLERMEQQEKADTDKDRRFSIRTIIIALRSILLTFIE